MMEIFRHVDQFAHGTINADNLRVFFRGFDFCADLEEEDLLNWIRRYDRDVDNRLDFADFVTSLGPYCQYTQKAKETEADKKATIVEDEMEAESLLHPILEEAPAQRCMVKKGKGPGSQRNFNSRTFSKMEKTTAASINNQTNVRSQRNGLKMAQSYNQSREEMSVNIKSHNATQHAVKPTSMNSNNKHF